MNVLMLSSASTDIDPYYLSIARSIAHILARNDFDLVYGGSSKSMMGICYQEFALNNRKIYSYTTQKYMDDIPNLPHADHFIRETTFDMKRDMYQNSDLIVIMAGGIGTVSELFAYIEENRSNDKNIPIEIYDEDHYYDNLINSLKIMQEKGFISSNFNEFVSISHNRQEFEEHINKVIIKERNR